MDSLPTGSDKLLELRAGNIYVVIKSKNPHPRLSGDRILQQNSEIRISGMQVSSVKIWGAEKIPADNGKLNASFYAFSVAPLFFEQTDYEILVRSRDGKPVSLWHENYQIRSKVSAIDESRDLISGMVNFGNCAGFSDLEIFHDGKKALVLRIEVFPSKITYKEDYQAMLRDISNEISGAVLDFMQSTYREFSIGNAQSAMPALFFELINQLFDKFQSAANRILAAPHHKLCVEHPVVAAHKIKKTDSYTRKWLQKHPQHVLVLENGYSAAKAPTVQKQITYNTSENQFTKYILKTTAQRLQDFRERYTRSTHAPEAAVLGRVDAMVSALNKLVSNSFLHSVDDYKPTQSMSLVFEMAPGYRELYKYYLMLQRGLSVHGDVFRMSLKDTALLYEYWCFIKLVALLKKKYRLASSDVIRVDNTGVTISLVKGQKSQVRFLNPRTGETITLAYNPGEQNTQTANQRPDNVLTLEKKGADIPYMYVFDAKYRIESNPEDPYYPDTKPGPKVEDINTMHRYRDAIVYENTAGSRFVFEKKMFGAYVLFPYDDPQGEYKNHRFYKSIETVNIGAIPFLPGTTELLEKFLAELVADSPESAFERASLPRGIEEKLAKTDWRRPDVLIGSVRSKAQFYDNLKRNYYYLPAEFMDENLPPVKYIALYQSVTLFGDEAGIRYWGKITKMKRLNREQIDFPYDSGKAKKPYYAFMVEKWEPLETVIAARDEGVYEPRFTNLLLLQSCRQSYELFNIHSEAEFRLMQEIRQAFYDLSVSSGDNKTLVYRINDSHTIDVSQGHFVILNQNGEILDKISVSSFQRSPRAGFNRIKALVDL